MKLVFLVIFIITINGCASTTEKSTNNAKKTSEELQLRAIFESNLSKVPLIYKSQEHFDAKWNKTNNIETLLEKTSSYAVSGTGTNSTVDKPASTLVNGEPEINISKKQLTYNVVWDTDNPWCYTTRQCLESEEQIKNFAKGYTQSLISGELTCKSAFLWEYLAYGSSVIYNLYDAKGIQFYSYEININNCPTNKQSF